MATTPKRRRSRGTGALFKNRHGNYCYQYTDRDGNKRTKSLRTKNKTEALEKVAAFTKTQEATDQAEVVVQIAKARKLIKSRDLPLVKDAPCKFGFSEKDGQFYCEWTDTLETGSKRVYSEPLASKNRKRAKKQAAELVKSPVWDAFLHTNPSASAGTRRNYRRALDDFVDWLQKRYPDVGSFTQVDAEIAGAYLVSLWDTGISANTYQYRRNALGHITDRIAPMFYIESNPWPLTERKRETKQKRLALTSPQLAKLLAAFDDHKKDIAMRDEMRTLALLCVYTGARLVDAATMEWSSVDLSAGKVTYTPRKTAHTGKTALVPILPPLATVLKTIETQSGYILPTIAPLYERNPDAVQKPLVAIIQGVTGDGHELNGTKGQRKIDRSPYGAHSLRHTFASMAAMSGAKPAYLARMLGDNITTVQKYYVNVGYGVKLTKGFEKLPKLIEAKATTDPERAALHRLADELPIDKVRELLKAATGTKQLEGE